MKMSSMPSPSSFSATLADRHSSSWSSATPATRAVNRIVMPRSVADRADNPGSSPTRIAAPFHLLPDRLLPVARSPAHLLPDRLLTCSPAPLLPCSPARRGSAQSPDIGNWAIFRELKGQSIVLRYMRSEVPYI